MTGCDGVGTKLEVLLERDLLEIAGKDLVAMNVNDILTTGGDPLLFLDYVGISALDEVRITRLIAGMSEYLESCNCILAGGETAEMPGIVPPGIIELSQSLRYEESVKSGEAFPRAHFGLAATNLEKSFLVTGSISKRKLLTDTGRDFARSPARTVLLPNSGVNCPSGINDIPD